MITKQWTMTEYSLFYYPYASFTGRQLLLPKVAALWFDRLVLRDPLGASWDSVGADYIARDAVRQLKDVGNREIVIQATVLAKYEQFVAVATSAWGWLRATSVPAQSACSTGRTYFFRQSGGAKPIL